MFDEKISGRVWQDNSDFDKVKDFLGSRPSGDGRKNLFATLTQLGDL